MDTRKITETKPKKAAAKKSASSKTIPDQDFSVTTQNGVLELQKGSRGYRWVFNAFSGAQHLGHKWVRTREAAIEAGVQWEQETYRF